MGSAWNQLEQMLTCAICLDKFKNPRLLPCQHSFCGDACMDGLVDYARRQIKCPECRAEHRIPYQGVQSLPLNVTLIRFLELHARITGEEPEPVPTFMEKCSICGEKVEGVQRCSHCDKKVCPECKEAHVDLLRREINRINGQSKRSICKLQDFKETLGKAADKLQVNYATVKHEIEDSCKRLMSDLERKQARLLEELDHFVEQERHTIGRLQVCLVDEIEVLESNLQLAEEKLVSNKFKWTDAELSECKEIYNKTMEFVRLFDPEIGDFTRKIRFIMIPEFEALKRRLCELGELKFTESAQSLIANSFQYCNATGSVALELCQAAAAAAAAATAAASATGNQATSSFGAYGLAHSNSNTNLDSQLARLQASQTSQAGQLLELPNTLMRSQSDHRLASQFQARLKQQEAAAAAGATGSGRYRQSDFDSGTDTAALRSRYAPPRSAGKDYSSDLLRDWPRPSDNDDSTPLGSSIQFKSAFMRRKEKERQQQASAYSYGTADDDDDLTSEASFGAGSLMSASTGRNVRFYDQHYGEQNQETSAGGLAGRLSVAKVFDCKEVVHAPFSGVPKLDECPNFQTRLHQLGAKALVDKRHAEEEGKRDKDLVDSARLAMSKASERIHRHMSEEDEIEKQKQANKLADEQRTSANVMAASTGLRESASQRRDAPSSRRWDENATRTESAQSEVDTTSANSTTAGQSAAQDSPASSSPATPTSVSALPGGRRSLYGQAVTERSKRQLSSAIQDAVNYTRRRTSLRDEADESQQEADRNRQEESESSSVISTMAPGSSGTIRARRTLRSSGRSMSKQSSSDRQQSVEVSENGSPTTPTTGTRRRRLLRGESSRQGSVDSSSTAQSERTSNNSRPKNYPIGSGGGSELTNEPEETEQQSAASSTYSGSFRRPARQQDSPVDADSRLKLTGRSATSTTTDEEDDNDDDDDNDKDNDDDNDNDTKEASDRHGRDSAASSWRPSHLSRQQSSRASSSAGPTLDDSDQADEDSADDNEPENGRGAAGKRNADNRRSREFLPSAVNRLLDRSAQIRRDSKEQRTRADSPQRSTASGAEAEDSRPAGSISSIRQRLAYQRSQSIRADVDEDAATNSSQSLYTTASSQASGRRSSAEDEQHVSSSSSGRRPSSSSTDRTVISRHEPASSDRTDSLGSGSTTRYSAGRRNSNDVDSPSGYTSRFLSRSRTSAALSSTTAPSYGSSSSSTSKYRDYSNLEDRDQPRHHNKRDSGLQESASSSSSTGRSYLSSRDRFMQSASVMSSGASGVTSSSSSSATGSNLASSSAGYSRPGAASSSAVNRPGHAESHSQYLRNKFSRRNSSNSSSNSSAAAHNLLSRSRSSHGFSLQDSKDLSISRDSDDSDSEARPTSSRHSAGGRRNSLLGAATPTSERSRSSLYSNKGRMLFKLGSRGSTPGHFTWPRGVSVGSLGGGSDIVVVADSSNHRVQVFDLQGRFLNEFGAYGSAHGEFDCLAGVALNRRTKQFVVSDRYNHRVQLFDSSGRFVRAFGDMGRDLGGKFNLPWGVACDSSSGLIYVCDKENHRVQVFDSDGQFVSKFGSMGVQPGQLQHPHYIAAAHNRIVVTDTNNHRVQLFDSSGRLERTLGSEGSSSGQFKFPRGVAMDELGNLIVGDSGNNRLQIFNSQGQFVSSIGTWGSSEGEFKGIEGVAVDSNTNNIFVCDRENHRIQVF